MSTLVVVGMKGVSKPVARKKKPTKECFNCKRVISIDNFYKTNSKFADGYIPMCKQCVRETVDENDLRSVLDFLSFINKPFKKKYWESAIKSNRDTLGHYITMINSLKELKNKTFTDSDDISEVEFEMVKNEGENDYGLDLEEMRLKWGSRYKPEEYARLEAKYNEMMKNYDIVEPHHKHMLIQICKMEIEKDRLFDEGDFDAYNKLDKTYRETIKEAGFSPKEKLGSNEQKGIRSFGQIWEEVEKMGFIPPWEEYKIEESKDLLDRMLLAYVNHVRKLLNLETLSELPEDLEKEVWGDDA